MRPNLIFTAVVLMTAAAFGQQPGPRPGPCFYGCGPYVPLFTTPMISLQTVSPNPVGASNATTGLIAGATNATLSQVQGSTSSVYTEPVWYQGGGAPLASSQVHLGPEPIGREGHLVHESFRESMEDERPPQGHGRHGEAAGWMYFTEREHTSNLVRPTVEAKAGHVYTNDDVTRQNDKNGEVRYDGKREKL